MLCDRILGNLDDDPPARWAGCARDAVDVMWHECGRRALRKVSRDGRRLRILLPPGVTLRHGDVLAADAGAVVAVHVVPTEVLVVRPRDLAEMAAVALEVGNLHAPAAVAGGALLVIPDGPVEAVLWRLGVPHDVQVRRFVPAPIAGMATALLAADFAVVRRGATEITAQD